MTELDRDVDVRRIVLFGVGLAVLVAVCAAAVWFLVVGLRASAVASDPPPPLLPEARAPEPPPAPRLQTDPVSDLAALRARERELLEGWAWVDRGAGIARIPVAEAMDLLLVQPPAAPAPAAEPR